MKEPKEEITFEEQEIQKRLFNENRSIAFSVEMKGAIVQNAGFYYSDALDDFDEDIDSLIHRLRTYQKDVHTFHERFDPEYKKIGE